jgi:hypothetical protein
VKVIKFGLLGLIAIVVLACIIVYFSLNGIIKSQVESQGEAATGVDTDLEGVAVSPFSGQLGLSEFTLANPEGFADEPIFRFDDADIKVQLMSLLEEEVVVNHLKVDGARVMVTLNGTDLNIKKLYEQIQERGQSDDTTTDEPAKDSAGKAMVIEDLQIINTKVIGELKLPGLPEPLKVDLPLADIIEKEVRGAEMGDIIAFVAETIMINASRSMAEFSPDLDQFLGGVQEAANAAVGDVKKQTEQVVDQAANEIDKVLPGAGDAARNAAKKELDKGAEKLGKEIGNLLGGNEEASE